MPDQPQTQLRQRSESSNATPVDSKRKQLKIPDSVAHPIIYVRGYAMTAGQQNETAADPFCGFNLGSTVYRASPDKKAPPKKFIFESPLIRLALECGYSDVYEEGLDIQDEGGDRPIPRRSIIIHRYYDDVSELLGSRKAPSISDFAKGLSELILKVQKLVCAPAPRTTLCPRTSAAI